MNNENKKPKLSGGRPPKAQVRVLRAEFARLMGVSRQTVSEWVEKGWLTVGADNRIDPSKGAKEVYGNMDPLRAQAHVMRDAMDGRHELELEIEALRNELAETKQRIVYDLEEALIHAQSSIAAWMLFSERASEPIQALNMADDALRCFETAWNKVAHPRLLPGSRPRSIEDVMWRNGLGYREKDKALQIPEISVIAKRTQAEYVLLRAEYGLPADFLPDMKLETVEDVLPHLDICLAELEKLDQIEREQALNNSQNKEENNCKSVN